MSRAVAAPLDVLVAGGGPVGLGTAIMAARAGLSVAVAEPRRAPVDKACGEGLMPPAVTALRALGVQPDGWPLRGIRYVSGARSVAAAFTAGPGLGVRRTRLHAALRAAAERAGVELIEAAVGEVRQDGAGVEALGRRARYLLAADGLHSPVRRRLGLTAPSADRRYGVRRHFECPPWSEYVEVHWSRGAEAYVTPVGPRTVGVAVLFRGRGSFPDWLAGFPELRERLDGVPAASGVLGAGPLRQRAIRPSSGRVLLVGDAAGYVDALTGEGINVGLAGAAAAVCCVAADRPWDYPAQWRRVTRRYRLLTEALVRVGATRLRPLLVPVATALPGVFAAAVDALAAPAP